MRDGTPAEIGKLGPVERGPGRRLLERPAAHGRITEVQAGHRLPDRRQVVGILRQNTLAAALKEWGTLRRTIHAARYLSDPAYRRKIARQLNKGESLHALRRDLHYAQQGTIGKPLLADQTEQAWCLTVLTNSVITWVTEYYQLAVQELRATGRDVPDELLAHISPAHSENINFFGVITVDVEAELAKLDQAGWRPLRPAAPALSMLL